MAKMSILLLSSIFLFILTNSLYSCSLQIAVRLAVYPPPMTMNSQDLQKIITSANQPAVINEAAELGNQPQIQESFTGSAPVSPFWEVQTSKLSDGILVTYLMK